jgi:hypothetical protein
VREHEDEDGLLAQHPLDGRAKMAAVQLLVVAPGVHSGGAEHPTNPAQHAVSPRHR